MPQRNLSYQANKLTQNIEFVQTKIYLHFLYQLEQFIRLPEKNINNNINNDQYFDEKLHVLPDDYNDNGN